jgi:NAD dependent epimerase/dehydratase family enzyme
MLSAVFGGQAEAICTSTRAVPETLRGAGFSWEHQSLGEALQWALADATG